MQQSTPLCLFTARVEKQNGEYVLTIPEQEIELGTLQPDETYRVGVYTASSATGSTEDTQQETSNQRISDTQENRRSVMSTEVVMLFRRLRTRVVQSLHQILTRTNHQ